MYPCVPTMWVVTALWPVLARPKLAILARIRASRRTLLLLMSLCTTRGQVCSWMYCRPWARSSAMWRRVRQSRRRARSRSSSHRSREPFSTYSYTRKQSPVAELMQNPSSFTRLLWFTFCRILSSSQASHFIFLTANTSPSMLALYTLPWMRCASSNPPVPRSSSSTLNTLYLSSHSDMSLIKNLSPAPAPPDALLANLPPSTPSPLTTGSPRRPFLRRLQRQASSSICSSQSAPTTPSPTAKPVTTPFRSLLTTVPAGDADGGGDAGVTETLFRSTIGGRNCGTCRRSGTSISENSCVPRSGPLKETSDWASTPKSEAMDA
uniref:Uncharacterized protein n=1 Tax=Arundo donax TaxID=35708 RepID=A0A0A9E1V3_ARUDO